MLKLQACTPDLRFFLGYSNCLAEGTGKTSITEAFLQFWNRIFGLPQERPCWPILTQVETFASEYPVALSLLPA